jgi:hypothetical protein
MSMVLESRSYLILVTYVQFCYVDTKADWVLLFIIKHSNDISMCD